MNRFQCTLLVAFVLPLPGCVACGKVVGFLIDAIEFGDSDSHIDDGVFERKGMSRDSPDGRQLQFEENNVDSLDD